MTTIYIADTGVFARSGGPDNDKFQRLRSAVRQTGTELLIPQSVYEELGGDPATDQYPSGEIPVPLGFEEGWIVVADDLNYTDSLVSSIMDATRRFITNETGRDEDTVEKPDTELVGLAAQLLDSGEANQIVLLTTDKPAGRAAESLLPKHGFPSQVEWRYVSEEFLETLTPDEFR